MVAPGGGKVGGLNNLGTTVESGSSSRKGLRAESRDAGVNQMARMRDVRAVR